MEIHGHEIYKLESFRVSRNDNAFQYTLYNHTYYYMVFTPIIMCLCQGQN